MCADQHDQSKFSGNTQDVKGGGGTASERPSEAVSSPKTAKRKITRVDFRFAYARAALSTFDGEVLSVAEVEGYFDRCDVSGVSGALLVAEKLMTPIFGDDGEVTHFKVCLGLPR